MELNCFINLIKEVEGDYIFALCVYVSAVMKT